MKSKWLAITVAFTAFAATPILSFAGVSTPPAAAPFDAGLSLLIAAGVGYASKKAYDKRKKSKLKDE